MKLICVCALLLMTSLSVAHNARDRSEGRHHVLRDLVWLDTEWVMAFRLSGGVQQSAYNSYTDHHDDDQPLARAFLSSSCLQPHTACCDQHYHSSLLNHWPSRYVDQVRVSLMKDQQEVAHFLFNGTGSTARNWFSADRVLNSSWTDLTTEPHNYFSIEGHHKPTPAWYQHSRRFYVFRNYGGCPNDNGWLSVQDQNIDVCSWANLNASHPFPAILYSKKDTYVNFNTADVGRADALIVAVKFLPMIDDLMIADRQTC